MRLLPCGVLLALSCAAASFDCKLAKTAVEKAVCANGELSALDERLAQSYKRALTKAGEGDLTLRAEQRRWLDAVADQCGGGTLVSCIREIYAARIGELDSRPAFDPASVKEYRLTDQSHLFDFVVRLQPAYPGGETGPGRVLIFRKGAATPFQTLSVDNIVDPNAIVVDDFNFDGREDFAIQNGGNGPYGSPSYGVYLFSSSMGRFQFSKPFTDLAAGSLDFLTVDAARKRITTSTKSGCCYHETDEYAVVDDRPVAVARVIRDAMKEAGYVFVSHQRMVNGKWQGTTERIADPDSQ